jgi:hypothetical protein
MRAPRTLSLVQSRRGFRARAFAACCVALAGCAPHGARVEGLTVTRLPSQARVASGGTPRHIFVLVLENHGYEQIVGSPSAPYFNSLVKRYGLATNYRAVAHPSLPNYLAMVGGSTFGISDDCTDCSVRANNLGAQLSAKGVSWKGYMEGMPSACYRGGSYGRYAKKHDPFVYFDDVASASSCGAHVVPLTQFARDVKANALPYFGFVTPDGCHDMHDCSVAMGDRWLRSFVPQFLGSAAYRAGGVLVVTFDENEGAAGNRVPTVVVSESVRAGARSGRALSHYALLRSIEDAFGVARLGHAADRATSSVLVTFGA